MPHLPCRLSHWASPPRGGAHRELTGAASGLGTRSQGGWRSPCDRQRDKVHGAYGWGAWNAVPLHFSGMAAAIPFPTASASCVNDVSPRPCTRGIF